MSRNSKVMITRFGDESALGVVESELPDPSKGEVQVAVQYSVVSGSDVNMRRGTYPFQKKPPLTPGYSVLGRVRANGPGCTQFKPGDLVACLSKYDGQAQLINLPEQFLVSVPEQVDPKQAVALVLDWLTAYQMLHRSAHVKEGQRVFIHGLGGAAGGALLRLSTLHRCQVSGTAAVSKHGELQALGATVYDYSNKDWIGHVQRQGGVAAVFDPLGYTSFDESYAILAKGGILVGYGMNLPSLTQTPRTPVLPVVAKLLARNLAFWTSRHTTFYGLNRTSRYYNPDLKQLFAWLASGKISVPIKATFALEEIQQAHRAYAGSKGTGSIVLAVS